MTTNMQPFSALQRGHGSGHGTESVCPVCLKRIPARKIRRGDDVVLAKQCPEHGDFEAVVWRGRRPSFADWTNAKTPSYPERPRTQVRDGCPYDCGLCPEHQQHTCTALLEITSRCDLGCPVCFASSGEPERSDPNLATIRGWFDRVREDGGECNVQLSGGEPTMRDDLPEIIAMGRERCFGFIQLNTNGLRLAREADYARKLKNAGLSSVFLQFDGVRDATHLALRGRPLNSAKRRAVDNCLEAGLGVVLVPTVVPGVNDEALGDILSFALKAGPLLRGVHFQPVSYFGRYPAPPADENRITLPEIMAALERQTGGLVRVEHFSPPGCEHALCSFHGAFLRTADGGLRPAREAKRSCCASANLIEPRPAAEGARKSIGYTARQWAAPSCSRQTEKPSDSLSMFLEQAQTWSFSISAMAFQDAWTLDLARLKECCIHVLSPDGRLVPFCAYNLTASDGRPLYRRRP